MKPSAKELSVSTLVTEIFQACDDMWEASRSGSDPQFEVYLEIGSHEFQAPNSYELYYSEHHVPDVRQLFKERRKSRNVIQALYQALWENHIIKMDVVVRPVHEGMRELLRAKLEIRLLLDHQHYSLASRSSALGAAYLHLWLWRGRRYKTPPRFIKPWLFFDWFGYLNVMRYDRIDDWLAGVWSKQPAWTLADASWHYGRYCESVRVMLGANVGRYDLERWI